MNKSTNNGNELISYILKKLWSKLDEKYGVKQELVIFYISIIAIIIFVFIYGDKF